MNGRAQAIAMGVAAVAGFAASTATADAPISAGALDEIVVTAQKRSESVQSVPISMTTFGGAALDQKAIENFFDYGTKVPNLAFSMTNEGIATSRTISIRGINGNNTTGFYIDETPLPDSIDPRVLDIDHIEVLRGPQGTLYGARSMGGTVRIITKTPDFSHFSADVHGGIADTWNTDRPNYTGDAVINLPISEDHVAARISGFYDTEAGFFKRRYCTNPATAGSTCFPLSTDPALTTTVNDIGATSSYGGSAALTVKFNEALTVTPRLMTQRTDYNGFPMSDYLVDPSGYPRTGYPYPSPAAQIPALPTPVIPAVTPGNFVQGRFFNIPEGGHDSWDLYSIAVNWRTGVGDVVSSTAYFDRTVIETEDSTDWLYASILPLTSLNIGIPTNPLPGPIPSSFTNEYSYQRFVQEVRFVSSLPGPVQFVIGGFYSDLHGRLPPVVGEDPPATAKGYGALLNGAYGGMGTCAVIGLCADPANVDLLWASDFKTRIREPAVFGEVSWKILPRLKATLGLRRSHVTTTTEGYEEGSLVQTPEPTQTVISESRSQREDSTTPKLQIDYQIDADRMVYTVASKGYRPGGIAQPLPPALCGAYLPPGVTVADASHFQSDSLWNYEIGTKTEWLDHRLTANAAAFYIKWNNIQQNILLGCGISYESNAAAAVSKGGELEVDARPIDPLQLSLGIGYQNAKITAASAASPQKAGDPVFQVPDWTGNGSVTWTQTLVPQWQLVATADYSYVGRSYSANNLTPINGEFLTRERPAYRLLDLRMALEHAAWEVALVGKNLANEHANLSDSQSIAVETPGRPRVVVNQPRTIGLELRTHF